MRFILSVMFERTVRFRTTVGVVLEQHNNCLANNNWWDVNTVYSSVINTIYSSSKWSQKNKWLQKNTLNPSLAFKPWRHNFESNYFSLILLVNTWRKYFGVNVLSNFYFRGNKYKSPEKKRKKPRWYGFVAQWEPSLNVC